LLCVNALVKIRLKDLLCLRPNRQQPDLFTVFCFVGVRSVLPYFARSVYVAEPHVKDILWSAANETLNPNHILNFLGLDVGKSPSHDFIFHRFNCPVFWGGSSSYLERFDGSQCPCYRRWYDFLLATPVQNMLDDLHVTVDGISADIFIQILPSYRFQGGRGKVGYWLPTVEGVEVAKYPYDLCDSVGTIIAFGFRSVDEPHDELLDEDFVGIVESLSPVGDKFGDYPVVFSAAGLGAVFAEIEGFPLDSDESPVGGFVMAVLWKLLFCVCH
jgi:hypothetical protein